MPDWLQLLGFPLLIFAARVVDVTLGTIRILFVARQQKLLAASVGFFEVLIWLVVISGVMTHLGAWYHFVAYAAGFATGNWVGITLEGKLAMGSLILRVITGKPADELIAHLNAQDIGVTVVDALGATGPVHILYLVLRRRDAANVLAEVQRFHPNAFYTLEDVRAVGRGIFPHRPLGHAVAAGGSRKGK